MNHYVPCLDSRLAEKVADSERIKRETEAFIARGGEVCKVDSSVFGDPTLPGCAVMRHQSQEAEKAKSVGLSRMHQATVRKRTKKNNSDIFGEP